jgi:hypothetical protein
LRIHTTNDKSGTRSRWKCRYVQPDDRRSPPDRSEKPLSARINVVTGAHSSRQPVTRLSVESPRRSRHRFLEPIHNVKEEPHAPHPQGKASRRSGLHTWKMPVSVSRAPSVAAKPRRVARYAALAALVAGAI